MKKIELNKLISRKKLLEESLEIIKEYSKKNINEHIPIEGKDSLFYGDDYAELLSIFTHIDDIVPRFNEIITRTTDKEELEKTENIKRSFHRFMNLYSNYLKYLRDRINHIRQNESFGH